MKAVIGLMGAFVDLLVFLVSLSVVLVLGMDILSTMM